MAAAITFTPQVKRWLGHTQSPQIMHLFTEVCNLNNEANEILSIVSPEVAPGPFTLVVSETRPFPEIFTLDSQIVIAPDRLQIGQFTIDLNQATSWEPGVNWGMLRRNMASWQNKLPALERMILNYRQQIGREATPVQQRLESGLGILLTGIQNQAQDEVQKGSVYSC